MEMGGGSGERSLAELKEQRHEELRALRTELENTQHLLPQVKDPEKHRAFEAEIEALRTRVEAASDALHDIERDLPAAA